jgi:hypothetical protein
VVVSLLGWAVRTAPTSRLPAPNPRVTRVHDYMQGKADWLAHGLPTKGEQANVLRARTCSARMWPRPGRTSLSAPSASGSPAPLRFALVLAQDRTLFGRPQGCPGRQPGCASTIWIGSPQPASHHQAGRRRRNVGKEALGGFYLLGAADPDQALAFAKQCPAPSGGVELRPIMDISWGLPSA